MDRNIQESKEYRLAKEWEMAVNSYSFDPRKFAAAIPGMHPTNQQSLYRLIRECIKVMADDSRRYDDRNRASHEEAKCIMEYLNEHGKYIPLGEFYQFNLSSCIRQQNSLTAQFVSFSLSNLANIFYPPQFLQ